jgi:transcriptional regulator with XRE-family HTH domain
MSRRADLSEFLRARRNALRPEDVGLAPGTRRRTAGLRREEVALLAGVSVSWYTWLEQGRPINASLDVLDSLARVLRLDPVEREHLLMLAGLPARRPLSPGRESAGVDRHSPALSPLKYAPGRADFLAGIRIDAVSGIAAVPPDERNSCRDSPTMLRAMVVDGRRGGALSQFRAEIVISPTILRWCHSSRASPWEPEFADCGRATMSQGSKRIAAFDHPTAGTWCSATTTRSRW